MQAMEFETHLENGLIHLPVSYQPVGCAEQSEAHLSRLMRFTLFSFVQHILLTTSCVCWQSTHLDVRLP